MADLSLSAAKAILLAVYAAARSDIETLRQLRLQYPRALRVDTTLRILLSYLPESIDTSQYAPLLADIANGEDGVSKHPIDVSFVEELNDDDARRRVKKLHLLPLACPSAHVDGLTDSLTLFLIHRAYRIDAETGLIAQLPELLAPFLERSDYLRTWLMSTILPLLRLNFEYYPQDDSVQTLEGFEQLDNKSAVETLLSKCQINGVGNDASPRTVGRDLRGLVGPWMFGDNQRKRRKLREDYDFSGQTIEPLEKSIEDIHSFNTWAEVFEWITSQAASTSWVTAVEAIEQWDGPGDVDLGGYDVSEMWFDDEDQQHAERQFARTAFAAAYLISEPSMEALSGVQRVLVRIIELLDYDRIPTLPAAASLLSPVSLSDKPAVSVSDIAQLKGLRVDTSNPLTKLSEETFLFMHASLVSAYLFTRSNDAISMARVAELALLQDEHQQMIELRKLFSAVINGPKGDDKYWIRLRNEILWLRDWGSDRFQGTHNIEGRGPFGKISRDFIEKEILKALLSNTRYTLAQSIYETSSERPLSTEQLQETVMAAAMSAYDNASNANRTRGGVKKCDDIIHTFPNTFRNTTSSVRTELLLKVTHTIGQFRLVLKKGEPFAPVVLRIHKDPVSLIGKILDQNAKSYTMVKDLIEVGNCMIGAGLTANNETELEADHQKSEEEERQEVKLRITSMCVDAALAEDDFETAYSYVMNNLSIDAQPAVSSSDPPAKRSSSRGLLARAPVKVQNDYSWRAARQTGKYRRNAQTLKPTHIGNASGNLDIRHLEQRMECLSLSLRLAPPDTLQEILSIWRRCEEELEVTMRAEAEQEDAWDEAGDQQVMPGGFGPPDVVGAAAAAAAAGDRMPSRSAGKATTEEAPMSLFDLTRASAAQAQRSFSALTALQGRAADKLVGERSRSFGGAVNEARAPEDMARGNISGVQGQRKRDQLREAAVGTLANGIGWLVGAPPIVREQRESD